MTTFAYESTFQYGSDETSYRLLSKDHVSTIDVDGRSLLKVEPEALRLLAKQAFEDVWDTTWLGSTKTLDVHVSGLRRKLGDDSSEPRFLHTVRGVGFVLAPASSADKGTI